MLARGVLLLILLPICGCQRGSEARRPGPPALDVNSTSLSRTRVVATLDAPLLPGTNLIWCASFQLAWKELAAALKVRQPMVEGSEALCRQLNAALDPRGYLSASNYYATAGYLTSDLVDRIRAEVRQKFPTARPLEFGSPPMQNLFAYGYVEASVPFAIPYINTKQPVAFRESSGKEVKVRTFGIGDKEKRNVWGLRGQVEVLFGKNLMHRRNDSGEFAVDPFKQSSGVQLIVACVKPRETLAATMQNVRDRAEAIKKANQEHAPPPPVGSLAPLGPSRTEVTKEEEAKERVLLPSNPSEEVQYYPDINDFEAGDTLVIPEMDWHILHHFAELENHLLVTSGAHGPPIILAVQDIVFRLDRHGASLRSEAGVAPAGISVPTHFEFTKPFLLLLKKRGAEQPFFVAWIDNAELLRRWE